MVSYCMQNAEKDNLAFFGIVNQIDLNLRPDLVYNRFSTQYSNDFLKEKLLDQFCIIVKPKAFISRDDVEQLVQLIRKKDRTSYGHYMRVQAKGNLSYNLL